MSFHYRCWLECEIADGSLRLRPRCLPLGVLEPFAIREQSPQLPPALTCRNRPRRACRGRSALFILCSEKWNPVLNRTPDESGRFCKPPPELIGQRDFRMRNVERGVRNVVQKKRQGRQNEYPRISPITAKSI